MRGPAGRRARRRLALGGLTAVLVALGVLPLADGRPTAALAGGPPPSLAPSVAAGPGYHHLGATSAGGWAGVLGRLTVRDPGVRAGTRDFVAARLLAKREAAGRIAWLEAGWAETGWGGDGRQRVYTYDTLRNAWTFHDRYPLRPGDEVWLYLHAHPGDSLWRAWLRWGGAWHLLTTEGLPLGATARVEQYVEVHIDHRHGADGFRVPPVAIDGVQVRTGADGGLRPWLGDVPTSAGPERGRYCVHWRRRYDTWTAGDCP